MSPAHVLSLLLRCLVILSSASMTPFRCSSITERKETQTSSYYTALLSTETPSMLVSTAFHSKIFRFASDTFLNSSALPCPVLLFYDSTDSSTLLSDRQQKSCRSVNSLIAFVLTSTLTHRMPYPISDDAHPEGILPPALNARNQLYHSLHRDAIAAVFSNLHALSLSPP
jgi:hypothetical protein